MDIQKTPDHKKEDPNGEKKIHRPEFIILQSDEGEDDLGAFATAHSEYYDSLKKLNKVQFSVPLRLVIALAFFVLLFLSVLALFFCSISLILSTVTLFMIKEMNANLYKSWKNVKKVLVFTVGLFLAIFSPALGLGLIVLYFMLLGEQLNKSFVSRLFKFRSMD